MRGFRLLPNPERSAIGEEIERAFVWKFTRRAQHLPMVVEIVGADDKIDMFLKTLAGMIGIGLVRLRKVKVLQYGRNDERNA